MCLYSRFRSLWSGDWERLRCFFERFGGGFWPRLLETSTSHRDSSDSASIVRLTLTNVRREGRQDSEDILPHSTGSSRGR